MKFSVFFIHTFRYRASLYGSKTRKSDRIKLTNVFSDDCDTSALTPELN
jgi:hypothetical protein